MAAIVVRRAGPVKPARLCYHCLPFSLKVISTMFSRTRTRLTNFFSLPPAQVAHPDLARDFRRNFLANMLDMTTWLFGISFISVSAILPVFASRLTESPIVIGLIPAILDAGWFLPQLFLAPLVERQPRKLPLVLWLGALERVPFLLMPLVALWVPTLPAGTGIAVFLALQAWRALGSGVVAVPWQELMAKVIPVTHRGRFFGVAHLAGQLLGVGGAALAAVILAALPYPQNFALSFAVGAAGVWLSFIFLVFTKEPALPPPAGAPATRLDREYARRLWQILKRDANFRLYLISRWLTYLGTMASGFLAVYAVKRFSLADDVAGIFTGLLFLTGVVGYAIWGMLGDRHGHKRVMVLATVLWLATLGVALLANAAWVFYLVFALMGLSSSAGQLSDLNLAMEFGNEAERPTYVGLTRTVTGPALLIAPIFGGWLAQTWGYPALLTAALVFAVAGGGLLAWGVREPRHLAAAVTPAPAPVAEG